MGVIGRWDDWKCLRCDSVNGPRSGPHCDICADEGEHGEVVELVRATDARGAVERLGEYQRSFARIQEAIGYIDGNADAVDEIASALDAVRGR